MDKTALFWLLNLNNFDEHPLWLRSNQFSADCHYWQCHSVKSQKVGIIFITFHRSTRGQDERNRELWLVDREVQTSFLDRSHFHPDRSSDDHLIILISEARITRSPLDQNQQQQRQQKSVNITSSRLYIFDFEACSFCAPRSFFADFWINIPTSVYLTLG